jgi:DNA-binding LacI/PurR family transcriptional regulator
MISKFEIPHKTSLASQTGACIREGIRKGLWEKWLPSERELCEELQVSRFTLRAALKELAREGITKAVPKKGTQILISAITRRNRRNLSVGVMTPDRLTDVRPHYSLWISKLRTLLLKNEIQFHVIEGHHLFEGSIEKGLKKLLAQSSHNCWILHRTTEPIQQWFLDNRIPCVVAGTPATGIDLPFVDIDNQALGLHALGHFYSKGHRKMAYLYDDGMTGGGRIGVKTIEHGLSHYSDKPMRTSTFDLDSSLEKCLRVLDRILKMDDPPTALLIGSSFKCIATMSHLQNKGYKIPEDISIICRDNDYFLNYYTPTPSRYTIDPTKFAKRIFNVTMKVVNREVITKRADLVMPDFIEGQSVASIK